MITATVIALVVFRAVAAVVATVKLHKAPPRSEVPAHPRAVVRHHAPTGATIH